MKIRSGAVFVFKIGELSAPLYRPQLGCVIREQDNSPLDNSPLESTGVNIRIDIKITNKY